MARRSLCLFVGLVLLCANARAQPIGADESAAAPLPNGQRYEIDVQLDPRTRVVAGRERIHLQNTSRNALTELYFHLYPNAFENPSTVFMREHGTRLRGLPLARTGRLQLLELTTTQGDDLLAASDFELIAGDRTQLRVRLPRPVPPGAALDLALRFRTQLPSLVARAGFAGDFFMVAQFFPKLAKLEPDGSWASFPYHGLGEFYADFAHYTLRVRMPREYVVASGGVLAKSTSHGETREDEFVSARVHDVAFAAYPHFQRHAFLHAGVRVELFAPRGYDAAVARHVRVIRAGLTHFGRLFGPYPYPTLRVILPPRHAYGASGMEYPGLFVSAGPWWSTPLDLPDPAHDLVVAHELAHQWFSVMIANHEVAAPVLDEGLAQWATLDLTRALYAKSRALAWLGLSPHDLFPIARALFSRSRSATPSSLLPAHRYRAETLARAVYMRPAVVLNTLEQTHGRAHLEAALGHYARTQRFRHPTTGDLFAAFDHTYGRGFAERTLRPLLDGRSDDTLRPSPGGHDTSLVSTLLFCAQALMHWIGP